MISTSACQHWQPDRAANPAQQRRCYTTCRDTIRHPAWLLPSPWPPIPRVEPLIGPSPGQGGKPRRAGACLAETRPARRRVLVSQLEGTSCLPSGDATASGACQDASAVRCTAVGPLLRRAAQMVGGCCLGPCAILAALDVSAGMSRILANAPGAKDSRQVQGFAVPHARGTDCRCRTATAGALAARLNLRLDADDER